MREQGSNMGHFTLKDLARELGLSVSTVSRALRDHPGISAKTRERVAALAGERSYQPNLIAKSLQTRRTNIIGVIVPEIRHAFFSSVISGIEETANQAGFATMICQSHESMDREALHLRALLSQRVAGVLISLSKQTRTFEHLREVIRRGVPLVQFDRTAEELPTGRVVVDDARGACEAVTHLIKRGYRRIAFLGGLSHVSISRRRREGYEKALADHGLPLDEKYIIAGSYHEEDGRRGMRALLALDDPPDAVFAVNDPVAVGAFVHLKEHGARIPEDVALAGFSNNPITALLDPPLTTVDQYPFELGREAALMLLRHFDGSGESGALELKTIKTRLIVRRSTAGKE